MKILSRRAFPRRLCQVPVVYAFSDTDHYHPATMQNISKGGMCMESEYYLEPGTDIYIRTLSDTSGIADDYRGTVAWCRKWKEAEDQKPCFGVGIRFWVNVCTQCGEAIAWRNIHLTDNAICLCPDCASHLNHLPQGKLRECIENYLMGNVL